MKILLYLVLLFVTSLGFSQTDKKTTLPSSDETLYFSQQVTTKPQFVGGEIALDKFIKRNFKLPTTKNLNGQVLVSFIVEKNGSLTNIGILEDVGHGTGDEAIRVMTVSPLWSPGTLNGNPVRTQFNLTIPVVTN